MEKKLSTAGVFVTWEEIPDQRTIFELFFETSSDDKMARCFLLALFLLLDGKTFLILYIFHSTSSSNIVISIVLVAVLNNLGYILGNLKCHDVCCVFLDGFYLFSFSVFNETAVVWCIF